MLAAVRRPRGAAPLAAFVAVAPLLLSPAAPAAGAPDAPMLAIRVVGFDDSSPAPLASLEALGGLVLRVDGLLHVAVVAAPEGAAFDDAAARLPGVAFVEPDFPVQTYAFEGVDELEHAQWGLAAIRARQAWALLPERTTHPTIAILDTGADWHHPDLRGAMWDGNGFHGDDLTGYATAAQCAVELLRSPACFYMRQPPEEITGPMDFSGHGTHVAAIAGAERDGQGIAGVSPAVLRIVKVLPLGNSVFGSIHVVASGIALAAANGADIISMSLGCACQSDTLERAVQFAWAAGALIVAAAGNSNNNQTVYPAGFREVIGVAATNVADQRWVWDNGIGSSFGKHVELAAPGEGVLSARSRWTTDFGFVYVGLGHKAMTGTSMATPHVAGVAALVWEANPRLTNHEVRRILDTTARDLGPYGWDPEFGHGIVDAEAAVRAALAAATSP